VRWNGRLVYVVSLSSSHLSGSAHRPERSMLTELRRRVSAEIAKYRITGLFSPGELRLIEALWLEGISMRALAQREGVTAQAVGYRIARLRNRAPRFYSWWRLKNRSRARH
jgi:hypothetical protein